MIGSLRGTVLDRIPASPPEVLLEVGGVGYRVSVTPAVLATAELGGPLFLHVHTHVREDALVLYGFGSRDERACFEALLGAHGVGPALALAILSALSPAALQRALLADDADALTAVPGVGKKTAARLLVELKARLDLDLDGDLVPVGAASSARAEVRAALAGLGYGPEEVREAVRDLPDDGPVEDLLKSALAVLGGGSRRMRQDPSSRTAGVAGAG
ncbi:MAG TPA: Holliday junction branch migration protein RuvA [Acidimicrobiales bacterium]|nr:Holliday junction branch migration protein RuvA [Acidimicrobiales bacterium]